MSTIVVIPIPKSFNDPVPNYKTKRAIKDVELKKGTKVKDSKELFSQLDI